MKRRIIFSATLALLGVTIGHPAQGGQRALSTELATEYSRIGLVIEPTAPPVFPAGKRAPFQWPVFALDGEPVTCRMQAAAPWAEEVWLRVTVGVDDRETRIIEVRTAESGERIGQMDIRFAYPLQTFELAIPGPLLERVLSEGITLYQSGHDKPLWLIGGPDATIPAEFQPHLLVVTAPGNRLANFRQMLASRASVQSFGWIEGCVLEGLRALGSDDPATPAGAARAAHWNLFSPERGRLIYENHHSQPYDDQVHTIEAGLPFADLARHDPGNPLIDTLLRFAAASTRADGAIQDMAEPSALTAEGSYTMAYSHAVISVMRNQPELAETALHQLNLAGERLWHDGALWLRHYAEHDSRTFRGWSRGVAWHALGVVRTIETLESRHDTHALKAELRRVAAWVLPLQRPDGLWGCFVEEPGITPDTAGSSGIAAALATGARLGILGPEAAAAAQRTTEAVVDFLTPDGLLSGVAQSNRGGEQLQRSDYRVIAFYGAGLFAQLLAECENPSALRSEPR